MALEQSILNSVKKNLGLGVDYDAFDHDVITHINTCFFTLNQLGIGPPEGFMIEDDVVTWADFVDGYVNVATENALKTYFYLKVRSYFDPPSTPHHISAINDQITELEHRLLTERELSRWGSAGEALPMNGPEVIDGGWG